MKFILILIAILFTNININAQLGDVLITGKIIHKKASKVIIKSEDTSYELPISRRYEVNQTISVEKGYYRMYIGEEYTPIYLKPNSNLSFTVDQKQFDETIAYTGELAPENNCLAKNMLLDEAFSERMKEVFSMKEKPFLKEIDNHISNKNKTLISAQIGHDFRVSEDRKLEMSRLNFLFMYPDYHRYYTKDSNFKVKNNYYDFISKIDFNKTELFKGENIQVLNQYVDYLAAKIKSSDNKYPTFENRMTVVNQLPNETLRDYYINHNYEYAISYSKDKMETVKLLLSASKDQKIKSKIENFLAKSNQLSEGKEAPKFTLESTNGMKSLDDYKGSYVYIDVWATWCGPCKQESPYYETLKKDYKDKNIKFVSICVWDNKATWSKYLVDKKLDGEQLFIEGQENDFVKNYMIKGVPTFILIDKEGKIIKHNCERPSDEDIRSIFDKLLSAK